jgi:hypothetical protein
MNRGAYAPPFDEALTGSFYEAGGVLYGGIMPASGGGTLTVPTTVLRGCFPTYSMPTDHAGTAEYVTFGFMVPTNWDMVSNFQLEVWYAQAAAETTGEKFVWNAKYGFMGYGDAAAGTFGDAAATTTLDAEGTVQYREYHTVIAIPYHNAHGTAEPGGFLSFKLHRRILGTTGEALLMGAKLGYWGTALVRGAGGPLTGTSPSKKLAANRDAH